MLFREALHSAFIEVQDARDAYRTRVGASLMSKAMVERFIEVQCLLLAPMCPHTVDYVWTEILKKVRSGFLRSSTPVIVSNPGLARVHSARALAGHERCGHRRDCAASRLLPGRLYEQHTQAHRSGGCTAQAKERSTTGMFMGSLSLCLRVCWCCCALRA
jgi:hypothetical protein